VDDEENIADLIAEVAKSLAMVGFTAKNLEEARAVARRERPDVALLDVRLPDGLGTSLISYLRKLDDRCEVIVMTSNTSFDVVVDSIRQGSTDFLSKPFSLGQLSEVLHRAIVRRRQRSAPAEPPPPAKVLLLDDDLVT